MAMASVTVTEVTTIFCTQSIQGVSCQPALLALPLLLLETVNLSFSSGSLLTWDQSLQQAGGAGDLR